MTTIQQLEKWRSENKISEDTFINAKHIFNNIKRNIDIKYSSPDSATRMVDFLYFVANDETLKNWINYYWVYRIAFTNSCVLFYYNKNRPVINGFIFDKEENMIHITDDRHWTRRSTTYQYEYSFKGFIDGSKSKGYNY